MKKFVNRVSKLDTRASLNSLKAHGEKAWIGGLAVMGDVSKYISEADFVSKLNDYKSDLSRAMDSGFKIGQIDAETGLKITPTNHRLLTLFFMSHPGKFHEMRQDSFFSRPGLWPMNPTAGRLLGPKEKFEMAGTSR